MTTIECPRCETTFETKATTATRCRSCRSVVHVGGGAGRRSSATRRATTVWSVEPADDEEEEEEEEEEGSSWWVSSWPLPRASGSTCTCELGGGGRQPRRSGALPITPHTFHGEWNYTIHPEAGR